MHILLAFPNTYYANLESNGKFDVDSSIKNEVQLILNPDKEISSEINRETIRETNREINRQTQLAGQIVK